MGKRIKNGFILFLCMAVLMTAMPVIRVDAADTMEEPVLDAGIYISSTTVSTGSYGYLSVQAENFADVSGMEFSIYYDASIMTNISCWSGWLVSGTTMDINTQTPGEIKCSFLSLDGIDGGGELLSFNFYVPETAATGNYSLRLAVGEVYDTNLTPISVAKRSGTLNVMKGTPSVQSVYFYSNIDKSEVKCGETFTYSLRADWPYGLSGGNFEFEYDRDLLELTDVALGSELQTSTSLSAINKDKAGYVKITYADIDAISETYGTEYFILTFRAKEDVSGHTKIRFSTNGLTSVDLNKLTASAIETEIYVKNPDEMPDMATLRFEVDEENSTRRNMRVNVILEGKSGVAAGDFTIQYSSWLMTCVAAEESEVIKNTDGAYLMTKETISDGSIYFSYINTNPFTKSQTIMTLDFEIIQWSSGTANLSISGKGVVDIDFKALPVEYETLSVYVDGKPIDVNNVNFWIEEGSYVYNGSNHYPKVLNDSGLVEGVDYWLGYSSNFDAGWADIWIYGMNNYQGQKTLTFEIIPANVQDYTITLSQESFYYDGTEKCPTVLVEGLKQGKDFTVTYSDNVNVGTATVTIEGIGNYQGTRVFMFKIEEASTPGPDEPEKPEGLPFTDVSEGKWFYNSVKWAYENGLLTGTSETTFDPNGQMTRGMLVTVLYRKEGRPAVEETSKFPDVNPKKYYAPAIIWASANKLVSGYTNGNFGPEDSITREQIAKILYLYAAYEGYDTSNSTDISGYKDAAKVSGYAKKYMQWAVAEGLIKGSNGELNPKGNATRAEISAILKRFVEKYEVTAY